jgi:ubiquitin-conjugating enzyme E2 S
MQRTNENISPKVLHLVLRQLAGLQQEKLDGVYFLENPEDPLDIQAVIGGPTETPYEGGAYRVKIVLGAEFPNQPPRAFFMTKIFHPNISANGDVCVNTLKRDWDPQNWNIGHILQVIRCLLIVPFPESALNEEAGRLFMESYSEYAAHAAMMNSIHAMPANTTSASPDCALVPGTGATETDEAEVKRKQKQAQKAKKTLKRL